MNDFTIEPYSSDHVHVWNEFVDRSDNGHFITKRSFMEYHSDRFSDCSAIIRRNGKICALFPACIADGVVISHAGLTFGGLIVGAKTRSADLPVALDALMDHYRSQGVRRIRSKALPAALSARTRGDVEWAMHQRGWRIESRELSSIVSLTGDLHYRSSKKENLKRAAKADVSSRRVEDATAIWAIVESALAIYHNVKPTHTLDEIHRLKMANPKNISVYEAILDSEVVAGAVLFQQKNFVHTQYLAASETGRRSNALDFLIDAVIQETRSRTPVFSFGISTENRGATLNEGLLFQKEGFGAEAITHDIYCVDL